MIEIDLHNAFVQADTNESDNALERDIKFLTWIGKRSFKLINAADYDREKPKACADGIEVLIIKGT